METTISLSPIPSTRPTPHTSPTPPSLFRLLHSRELVFLEFQGTIIHTHDASPLSAQLQKLGKLTIEEDVEGSIERVVLVIGYQKLQGRIIDLKFPFAVIKRSSSSSSGNDDDEGEEVSRLDESRGSGVSEVESGEGGKEVRMEVVEVVRRKIYFGTRPEPLNEMEDE